MSSEPMELAKNWDESKWQKVLPAYASIKWDGIPITFKLVDGTVVALSRQNEQFTSVPHLCALAQTILLTEGASFTAECMVHGLPFKDAGGIIRRAERDERIYGMVFDANLNNRPMDAYRTRIKQADALFEGVPHLRVVDYRLVETVAQVEQAWADIKAQMPDAEGMMLHSLTKPFAPGKRCWGMGRYKPQPTIDLEVVGFEEAVSEAGKPLGMVGRVNVRLVRDFGELPVPSGWEHMSDQPVGPLWSKVVGVGPGKLTHDERSEWWRWWLQREHGARLTLNKPKLPMAEIKYMPDPSYDALRQPTIQRFRTDKDEPDVLEYP